MYTITLSDSTVIGNLELNGNNFISDVIISDVMFQNNLGTVRIHDGEKEEIHSDMELVANRVVNDKSWFILAEKSEAKKDREAIETNLTDMQLALVEIYESLGGV